MRVVALALILSALPCHTSLAAYTDFSDYSQNREFEIGEEFQSKGLSFRVVGLIPQLSTARIFSDSLFPNPLFSDLHAGTGVEFLLPANTNEITFSYHISSGRVISINGVEPELPNDNSLSFWHGTSVAGVIISTEVEAQTGNPNGPFGVISETGVFTLRGPINSFAIAGVEVTIDDISVIVPEPSTAILLLAASVSLLTSRRRRRRLVRRGTGAGVVGRCD